jgi:hypothetical protein
MIQPIDHFPLQVLFVCFGLIVKYIIGILVVILGWDSGSAVSWWGYTAAHSILHLEMWIDGTLSSTLDLMGVESTCPQNKQM